MRSNVAWMVVLTVLTAGILLGGLFLLKRNGAATSEGDAPASAEETQIEKPASEVSADAGSLGTLSTTGNAPAALPAGASVRSRVVRLEELAMQNDAASLQAILDELTNTNQTVRAAAREAAMQFGSRDAIPRLKEVAEVTTDPHEKVALLDAVKYLELPSLSEARLPSPSEVSTNSAARRFRRGQNSGSRQVPR